MTHPANEAICMNYASDHRPRKTGERVGFIRRIIPTSVIVLGTLVLLRPAAVAQELPVPPVPPSSPPLAEIAPTPNVDAPAPVTTASDAPSVYVRLYRANLFDPSLGFAPGSRYQSSEDRKAIQTPGLSISVPLK